MKKTLLALAVASVATSAFANTNVYSYSNGNTSANLGVFAEARYVYSSFTDKSRDTTLSSYDKTTNKLSQGRLRFGVYGSITDSNNLTYSFYTRFQTRYAYNYSKTRGEVAEKDHSRNGVDLNRAYVQLSHPTFGSFLYGKYVTVADDKFGDDLEHGFFGSYGDSTPSFTAWSATTGAFDSVATYLAPEFYGVKGGLSYAEDKSSQYVYTKQLAAKASYNLAGNHVVFIYANTRDRADRQTLVNANSYDLAFYNDGLVQDFVLGADFAYQKTNDTSDSTDPTKHRAWSLAGKVSYTGFQYVQPFLNVAYVNEKVNYSSERVKSKHYNLAVGASSDVYKYQSAKVTVFGEYFYSKGKERTVGVEGHTKDTFQGFNVGAKVSF
ncbi:porin [Psittacicella gerlachiana]|uniref:Porin n=1 Tax=Psittacicella gerlachiana TaxID=2028574 RepID=A0A3A1YDK9_9GAMM|nr:porin [Psittacicella gerlachiana]RIY35280.1 hypothetical protein CKF59_03825 [Psittacicella gerlachiana]